MMAKIIFGRKRFFSLYVMIEDYTPFLRSAKVGTQAEEELGSSNQNKAHGGMLFSVFLDNYYALLYNPKPPIQKKHQI